MVTGSRLLTSFSPHRAAGAPTGGLVFVNEPRPEARVFGDQYWIFATYSAPYDQQTFMDCFSSPDLATWTKHPRIIDTTVIQWARRAMWAPSIVEKGGRYYLFFAANDIQNDSEV